MRLLDRGRAWPSRSLIEFPGPSGRFPSFLPARDGAGYWQKIERYIESRSDARFTHGICPSCIERLYSDPEPQQTS